MQKPTILIVAGGKNSRFFPLNTETHKGFLPLLGKPMIVRALKSLKKNNFNKYIKKFEIFEFHSQFMIILHK